MSKVFVITGAGSGLGRAMARHFAAEGHTIALLGRTLDKLDTVAGEIGSGAASFACDVTSPASVREAFAAIGKKFGAIDVLVNNAGIFLPFAIDEATDEQIVGTIATNLTGPMLCCREAIPLMNPGSRIINVSSESVAVPFAFLSAYQASKAGLERFSSALRLELADRKIGVSVVRAGQMMGPDMTPPPMTPEFGMKFMQTCKEQGVDLMGRGVSSYEAAVDAVAAVLAMKPDIQIELVTLSAVPQG